MSVPFATQGYKTVVGLREHAEGFEAVGAVWKKPISMGRGQDARSPSPVSP
jgi:hypothetical protein